jgi:hypothetical protein
MIIEERSTRQDNHERTAMTIQSGQDICDMTLGHDSLEKSAWAGPLVLPGHRSVRTGKPGHDIKTG